MLPTVSNVPARTKSRAGKLLSTVVPQLPVAVDDQRSRAPLGTFLPDL